MSGSLGGAVVASIGGVRLTSGDLVALGLLFGSWALIGPTIERSRRLRSVSRLMDDYRRRWMRAFMRRENRIFDSNILGELRHGTAFFASSTMIALGGAIALLGQAETLTQLARDLAIGPQSAALVEARGLVVIFFLANAFLKFVWAHRLFGYAAILMGAAPDHPAAGEGPTLADQAAEINITAARHFNRGLRSVYFALAALAWLLGAVPLIAATLATVALLLRREFASRSRRVLQAALDDGDERGG